MTRPLPTVDAATYAAIEDRLAALLGTELETLVVPGEAIIALEALARGVGGPDTRALNVVTGPYGAMMGHWLAASGGDVRTVEAAPGRAIETAAVSAALADGPVDVVCVVHAEAATGVVNPLAEIAAVVHARGAALIVDAVASVGCEPLDIDGLGLDAVVIGPQKALSGPAGVCGLSVGESVWSLMEANPQAPRDSILSLLDVRARWLGAGRATLSFVPHHLEMLALDTALADVAAEGLDAVIARHRRARDATRAGLRALGLELWAPDDAEAASVATLARPPAGVDVAALLAAIRLTAPVEPAPGPLATEALRVMHAGPAATLPVVLASLVAIADALLGLRGLGAGGDARAALDAAAQAWAA